MKMNIMISINRDYIGYACVMLMSLKEHHKGILLSVYILHNELQDEDFERIDEVIGSEGIELIPVFIPKGTVKDFEIGGWHESAAYRLLAADLFENTVERILHLDVDILITGDISELYNTPFEGNYLAACEDFLLDGERRDKCREFARDENTSFFNSGVLLFNIEKLASDGFYYQIYAEILKKYSDIYIKYPDQDILNLLFCDKTKYMNRIQYNYAPFFYQNHDKKNFYNTTEALQEHCRIVHMISATKPWENIRITAADELWWEYAKRTPFYDDMKRYHVHAMANQERQLMQMVEIGIERVIAMADSLEKILQAETLLQRIVEHETEITELFNGYTQ
ncbi:MAG: glycosyltransferase family 8 protein [Bacillus sp. (in: Bacteria)]|nr:glycosyltransferase family 8 protein [Bacillus sp. (in: firmicutes)]MCM1425849.1 glycosyltransferase family 8 protein [Eubacterium sp.]